MNYKITVNNLVQLYIILGQRSILPVSVKTRLT